MSIGLNTPPAPWGGAGRAETQAIADAMPKVIVVHFIAKITNVWCRMGEAAAVWLGCGLFILPRYVRLCRLDCGLFVLQSQVA